MYILYIDLGAFLTKILIEKVNWKKEKKIIYSKIIQTNGIDLHGIENFLKFFTHIKNIFHIIDYEISEKIKKIYLIYNFFIKKYFIYSNTIVIKNLISIEDLKKISKFNSNTDYVLHNYDYFILDNDIIVKNPINIKCNFLTIRKQLMLISYIYFDNFNQIFKKIQEEIPEQVAGIWILYEYIKNYYNNFIIIDGGYYTTRICLIENNLLQECFILNIGIFHLKQEISLKYKISHNDIEKIFKETNLLNSNSFLEEINRFYLDNLINKIFKSFRSNIFHIIDIPIFINGWNILNCLEYYLNQKWKRTFYIISNYFNFPMGFEYIYSCKEVKKN